MAGEQSTTIAHGLLQNFPWRESHGSKPAEDNQRRQIDVRQSTLFDQKLF